MIMIMTMSLLEVKRCGYMCQIRLIIFYSNDIIILEVRGCENENI